METLPPWYIAGFIIEIEPPRGRPMGFMPKLGMVREVDICSISSNLLSGHSGRGSESGLARNISAPESSPSQTP